MNIADAIITILGVTFVGELIELNPLFHDNLIPKILFIKIPTVFILSLFVVKIHEINLVIRKIRVCVVVLYGLFFFFCFVICYNFLLLWMYLS